MNRSRIPWLVNADGTQGYTWSPTTGCSPASAGCLNCWAKAYHVRYRGGDFSVKLHPEKLDEPLRLRKPSTIGVCLMGDIAHSDVPDEFMAAVFGVMAAADRHTFTVLTKRPARLRSLLSVDREYTKLAEDFCGVHDESDPLFRALNRGYFKSIPLRNVHLGVSVEDQRTADERIPILLDTPAAHRFVSLEPQIGAVNLSRWLGPCAACDVLDQPGAACADGCRGRDDTKINLVIQGCESGPRRRPFDVAWARSVRDQCAADGMPYYLKQIQRCTNDDCHAWLGDEPCGMQDHCESGGCNAVVEKPMLDGRQHLSLPWEVSR